MTDTVVTEPLIRGVVTQIELGLATVLLGEDAEEWVFPVTLLPADVAESDVLLFAGEGRDLRVVQRAGHLHDTVESRLSRGVNRRRMGLLAS